MQQYRVNFGLLIGLIVGTLVVSAATYGLHKFQINRNADALIASAEEAKAEGDLTRAIQDYSNYISIRPGDDEIRVRLANLWADVVEQPKIDPENYGRAITTLEDTVRQMPGEKALQSRLVDLYGRLEMFQQALDHLALMLEKYPDDAELHVKQMKYLLRARKLDGPDGALAKSKKLIGYDDKTDSFDAKNAIAPHDASAYANCSAMLRSVKDKPELADRVINQLVKENPDLPAAYLQRGQYYVNTGEPSRGQRDIDKAYQLAPNDADVLIVKAARAEANQRVDQARAYLEAGRKQYPEDSRFYQGLADLEAKDRNYENALKIIDDGLKAVPANKGTNLLVYKAELQFMANDIGGVRRTADDMRRSGFGDVFIEWVEARILLAQEKWYQASQALAEVQAKVGDRFAYADHLAMQLGLAYEKSGQIDKAVSAYQSVLQRNPNNDPARAGVQRVNRRLGVREQNPANGDLDKRLAEILQQPKDERDWTQFDKDLAQFAEERKIEGAALDLLWARQMLARADFAEARKRLVAGRNKDPENLGIQRMAVALLRTEDPKQGPAKALRLLDQIVENFGDQPELRLDRADCLIAQYREKLDDDWLKQELSSLSKIPAAWSDNEQVTFWNGLAARYVSLGMRDEVRSSLECVAALRPRGLSVWMDLFALALEDNDDVAMKDAQDQILKVVGSKDDSNWLYSEARRLLSLYRRGELDQKSLVDARQLTQRAMNDRPNWFALQLVSAEVALLEGNEKDALAHFDKAQELGRPNANAVLQHVRLLLKNGRFEPAKKLIEQLPQNVREGALGQVYAEVLMNTGDADDAVQAISAFAQADPKAADRQLALGKMLVRASSVPDQEESRRKELLTQAGAALKQAAALGPEVAQTWLALLTYQVMMQDLQGAEQTLQQAQLALPEDQLTAILAKGSEIMGHWFNAENVYLTALEAQPDNFRLAQQLAMFYLSKNYPRPDKSAKATPLVNRILHAGADGKLEAKDPTLMWARRAAARLLAGTGAYQQLLKAEKLLASNAQTGVLPAEDRLLMAEILAARPDPISRRKAKNLFEQVQKDQPLNLKDHMLLGQLYFSLGDWRKCKQQMQQTVARNPKSVEPRALYANMILQHGNKNDLSEAVRQVGRLREMAPNDQRTVQLMAELGGKTGKERQVRAYLFGLLPKVEKPEDIDEKQVPRMEFVASLLVTLDDLDDAEKIYRMIVARDPRKTLALAEFLGLHRGVDQCMKVLEETYDPESTAMVSRVAVAAIRTHRDEVGDKYDRQVQGWLDRGLLENPDSVGLLILRAELDDLAKNYDGATKIYQKLLARGDVTGDMRAVVLNNLAFLVALAGNQAEAGVDPLELIQEAAHILGPTADILDTEAVIYTRQGDYEEAIRDLDNSLAVNPTAGKYFHQAVAHLGAGENSAAVKAWDDAHKLDKNVRSTLNRMEFDTYDRTKDKIEQIRSQSQSLTRAAG